MYKIHTDINKDILKEQAMALTPWRKGPFLVGDLFIDSEWRSNIKIELLKDQLEQIKGKVVADVGCNNGYYLFKMLEYSPKRLIGIEPSTRCYEQFNWLNSMAKTNIEFYQLVAADMPEFCKMHGLMDVIFCLGVIYHRPDPVALLKQLKQSLSPDGFVILDSLIIDHKEPFALVPDGSYAGMSNAYFIPSISALENWAKKAKFKSFKLLATKETTLNEQRKTEWINGYSLDDFLDASGKTKEGYEPPKRAYVRLEI